MGILPDVAPAHVIAIVAFFLVFVQLVVLLFRYLEEIVRELEHRVKIIQDFLDYHVKRMQIFQ
ncbi:MAG: hypothetical protein HXS48_26305 [Theionarchaea archaeon]|nr:hypothetical protein [Theionarchaea archaeon]